MKILITGPQGSGKTTQAGEISKRLDLCMVKMGELLRERAKVPDELGKKLESDMNRGLLVDNVISSAIMKEELSHPRCAKGFVVDGYPRSIEQIRLFDPGYDIVIYLNTTVQTSLDRLIHRGRADDTPSAIKQRLETFEEETQKTVSYYEQMGKVIRINGERSINEVTEDILAALKEHEPSQNQN
jgi:adenylate kinase